MAEASRQPLSKNKLFWKIIVLLLQFVAVYLPPVGQVTPLGMHIIFILVGAIIGWIFIDLGWASITGIIALGISGAYPTFSAALAACLGNQTVWLMFGALMICAFVEKSGLADFIAGFLLNLKVSRKSPFVMSFFFFLGAYAVGAIAACQVSIILFIGLYRGLAEAAGVKSGDLINSYWLCGLALCAVFGEMFPPWKISMIIVMNLYNSAMATTAFSLWGLLWSIGGSVLLTIVYILFCRYIIRIDLSRFDVNSLNIETVSPTKEQKTLLWFILVMVVLLLVPSVFSSSEIPVFAFMSNLGFGGLMLALVIAMMAWPVDGKPLMDMGKLSGNFNWNIFWMGAFYTTISTFISKPEVGISASLSQLFGPLLNVMPAVVFVLLAIFLSMILSQFLNNLVIGLVFISAIMALNGSIEGINMAAAVVAIYLASNCVCALPSANPVNAITFSNTDLISFKNESTLGWKANFVMAAFCCIMYFVLAAFFTLIGLV